MSKQKEVILGQEREIKDKTGEANRLREQNNEAQLKIKELEHNISKHKKDSADAEARVSMHTYTQTLTILALYTFGFDIFCLLRVLVLTLCPLTSIFIALKNCVLLVGFGSSALYL